MVDLVEEWEDIARYTRYLPENIRAGSSYQFRKAEDNVEIKVRVCICSYTTPRALQPHTTRLLGSCCEQTYQSQQQLQNSHSPPTVEEGVSRLFPSSFEITLPAVYPAT